MAFKQALHFQEYRSEKSNRACWQSEPPREPQQSTAPESRHLPPPDDIQAVPAPWPSARCPRGLAAHAQVKSFIKPSDLMDG